MLGSLTDASCRPDRSDHTLVAHLHTAPTATATQQPRAQPACPLLNLHAADRCLLLPVALLASLPASVEALVVPAGTPNTLTVDRLLPPHCVLCLPTSNPTMASKQQLDPTYDHYDYPTISPNAQSGHPGHTTPQQDAQVFQLRMMLEAEGYTDRLDTLTMVKSPLCRRRRRTRARG